MLLTEGIGNGKRIRLARLYERNGKGMFLVPMDHSVTKGPIATRDGLERIVAAVADNGADGIVVHKGRARFVPARLLRGMRLVIHLSASTAESPDTDAKVLVAGVEEAVQLGADAISMHVNLGSDTETRQLADLGRVAEECARWGMPLLAMVYPRGPRIDDPTDPHLVAHAASVAADLGADIVKTPYTGSVATMKDVVESSPIPIIAAGGELVRDEAELYASLGEIMHAGAAGVAVGRNVFHAADVAGIARRIAAIVGEPAGNHWRVPDATAHALEETDETGLDRRT